MKGVIPGRFSASAGCSGAVTARTGVVAVRNGIGDRKIEMPQLSNSRTVHSSVDAIAFI
ncbi:hypothetical protein D3C81_2082190 [compost metagenome]